ncbi:MAG: cupin domain-containing protein [Burkholderiales bacterium]|nr:cupin domain-containing protein [Burkholderiales bacterium]
MAIQHAAPGDLIDIRPLGTHLRQTDSATLIRTDHLEVFRYVLPAGKVVQEHTAAGLMIVQCLEGAVEFEAKGRVQELIAGRMLYLADQEPHALKALEDSSLLVTLLLHRA